MYSLLLLPTLCLALLFPASDSPLQLADLAWARGDYPAALSGYLRILDSAQGDSALEEIALRTGELFQVTEVTTDGGVPQFGPGDTHFLYEAGTGSRRLTRVVATAAPTKTILEVRGWGAAFSPDGAKLAYVKAPESPAMTAAQAEVDTATTANRTERVNALNTLLNAAGRIAVVEIATGREAVLDTGTVSKASLFFAAGDIVIFSGSPERNSPQQLHAVGVNVPMTALTSDATDKLIAAINSKGTALLFTPRTPGAGRGGRGTGGGNTGRGGASSGRGSGGPPPAPTTFGVLSFPDRTVTMVTGTAPAFSADGGTIVYVQRTATDSSVMIAPTADPAAGAVVRKGPERLDAPAASADGARVAFQAMAREDWEVVAVNRDGTGEIRLTRDPQHDLLPQFVSPDRVLTVVGEARHRRSFLNDLPAGREIRLFHNNTVRTVAPEYAWKISGEGTRILVVADREGDTVSTERGLYMVDLSRKVTRDEVRNRLRANWSAEEALRSKAKRLYASMTNAVRSTVAEASVARVYGYEKALFDFDSKHISRPGNRLAAEYLVETYKSFGYTPELQWFDRENAMGGRTANVIATLKGTVNPELVYVVSSHYDSVVAGPGADDDSSGTAALLETARLLAGRPQPATIVFASFTGEEAGLLGSREFVRRAIADKMAIVGAINNDMVGWANDHRLDSTIRYTNAGIKDIQHAAAMEFTSLITYDTRYYRGTDAAAYYEAFGEISGGIGSYPILSSPHYHQSHDVLENMNHQLITEVAKTTVATVMLLASSPSRVTQLKVDRVSGSTATLSWTASPETGVTGYVVAYGPTGQPESQQTRVTKPSVTLSNIRPGTVVAVKAVTAKGGEGWDWARVMLQ
jgi:Peptidase family M28/Fibronectin type III domain